MRTRIAATIFFVAVGCMVAMATGVYAVFAQTLNSELDSALSDRTTSNLAAVTQMLGGGGSPLVSGENILRVYRTDGSIVFDGSPEIRGTDAERAFAMGAATGAASSADRPYADGSYRLNGVPLSASGSLVVVVSGVQLERLSEPLAELRLILAAAIPLTSLVLAAAAMLIARRALKPVGELTRTARSIAAGDLDRRIPESSVRDELGELGSTFNEMIQRLAQTIERERRFTADAAHELRTPLAAMTAAVDVTLSQERTAAEYQRALESIRAEAAGLSRLNQRLLWLSRMDAGVEHLSFERIDLAGLLGATVEAFAEAHEDVHVDVAHASEELTIEGDLSLLARAFSNVLENAAIHGGPGVSITVIASRSGDQAVVTISDDGPGVPEGFEAIAFSRFARGDESAASGSGLGLAIAASICRAHRASVRMVPRSRGTTIEFCFPIAFSERLIQASASPPTMGTIHSEE